MKFDPPLQPATLLKRYKRFLADVELETGELMTVHCANPGSMMGLKEEGARVWISDSQNPKRKLRYSWELVELPNDAMACINTARPNHIVHDAIRANAIPELAGYESCRPEVKYGTGSRIDLLLEDKKKPPCYVEIKSVTLSREPGKAEFPDSTTARGTKHMEELARRAVDGDRAVVFFLVSRTKTDHFTPAEDIDPAYGAALRNAIASGVEAICYCCRIDPTEIVLDHPIPIRL